MYDYVIVGAGSAGCVLANRISADPAVTVALVEAGGPDRKQEIRIPAAFSKLFKTPLDWNFATTPQKHLADRELYWPRQDARRQLVNQRDDVGTRAQGGLRRLERPGVELRGGAAVLPPD
jgi:flavin-dependent dehydrogenase